MRSLVRLVRAMVRIGRRLLSGGPSRSVTTKEWLPLLDMKAASEILETKRFSRSVSPVEMECPGGPRVLVVAPHPDDDTFGAGGAIVKAVAAGVEVRTLYATDGSIDPEQARLIREDARAVCEATGVVPTFLGCRTKDIPLTDKGTNDRIRSLIKDFDPKVILLTFLLDDHDDHRRVNQLLLEVARDLDLNGTEIWAYQVYSTVIPSVVVNITKQAERKRELIGMWQHVSGERDWAHYVLGMNAANCRYLRSRQPIYAEAFFVAPIKEYLAMCHRYFSHPPAEIYRSPTYHGAPELGVEGAVV